MQVQKDNDSNSIPLFVPRKLHKHSSTTTANIKNGHIKEQEITLSAETLPNGFLSSRRKSSVSPFSEPVDKIPIKVDVHQSSEGVLPNGYILKEESSSSKDASTMSSLKSILKSNRKGDNNVVSVPNSVLKTQIKSNTNEECIDMEEKDDFNEVRRKNSMVQFDIKNIEAIRKSSKIHLNDAFSRTPATNLSTSRPSVSLQRPSVSLHRPSIFAANYMENGDLLNFPMVNQKMSDLRKMLYSEEEKEDGLKQLGERIIQCDCFEFNLNNAAKIITVVVLVATFILVIRALAINR